MSKAKEKKKNGVVEVKNNHQTTTGYDNPPPFNSPESYKIGRDVGKDRV